jgi:hypothetical protein
VTRRRSPKTEPVADELDQYFAFGDTDEPFKAAEVREPESGILLPGCAAFDNLPWPDDVPVLVAADVTEPPEPDGHGRKALWTWFLETFPPGEGPQFDMREAARLQFDLLLPHFVSLNTWSWMHSREEAADLWNAFLRTLGYATPEPEPKKKRRKK